MNGWIILGTVPYMAMYVCMYVGWVRERGRGYMNDWEDRSFLIESNRIG